MQQATERLDAALDELEGFLQQILADSEGDKSVASLQEQLRKLTEERDRLRHDLDAERNRVRRLKAANEEVSGRLEAVMVTLKHMMPAVPG
jgi:septal ring factor EnvC (AmiA/AmiB activator)